MIMHWLVERFRNFDRKEAIGFGGEIHSYADLANLTEAFYNEVKSKINKSEVVAIISDYSFHSIALFVALLVNKNIIVPVTTNVKEEINERLDEAYVDWTLGFDDKGRLIVEKRGGVVQKHRIITNLQTDGSSGLIFFSSGSTGKPKAMVHNLDNLLESYRDKNPTVMRMLVFLMFDHIGGLNTMLNALCRGAVMFLPEKRDPDHICALIEKYNIAVLPSSPTFLNLVLISEATKRYDLSSLRIITYGTEAMPESLLNKLKKEFKKVKFIQTFGTSETGIAQTSSKSSTSTFMKIKDPNLKYRIVDGELWLKSKTQVMGYLNASMESFTEDGWFKTGDLVETTGEGYLKIIGRNKEIINVGGQKVVPGEVEAVLLEMEEINDCMVYAKSNVLTGQSVAADIVLKEVIDPKAIKKLVRKYCAEKLDNYKIPTKIRVVDKTNFGDRFKKIRINV